MGRTSRNGSPTYQNGTLSRSTNHARHDSMSDRCHPENKFWSQERLPGNFEIGCGVTVLSGGDDGRFWSQRYKANLEKLASGDLVQVVEVVRDLAGREAS